MILVLLLDHDDDDDDDNDDLDRTLAILIGIIAAVALLVVCVSYFRKFLCGDECGDGKGTTLFLYFCSESSTKP